MLNGAPTLPKTNMVPENCPSQKKVVFQPSIFRCNISFRERSMATSFFPGLIQGPEQPRHRVTRCFRLFSITWGLVRSTIARNKISSTVGYLQSSLKISSVLNLKWEPRFQIVRVYQAGNFLKQELNYLTFFPSFMCSRVTPNTAWSTHIPPDINVAAMHNAFQQTFHKRFNHIKGTTSLQPFWKQKKQPNNLGHEGWIQEIDDM